MNPIKLSQQLQDTLVSYLTTTFDVNRDGKEAVLASFIKNSLSRPRALFAGPYLELTSPYKTAETLQEMAQHGVITPRLLQMQCFQEGRPLPVDTPLFTHQATSLRKLCSEDRNIVVSSGTGSGKTECFLIPILNDLLIDPSPGVRAVLVYPLNALVNDQLDRLRVILRGTDIKFGRYTSELEYEAKKAEKQMQKDWQEMEPNRKKLFDQYPLPNEIIGRDQIQEQAMLPQILITNYAMLEYLLLRPQDNPLFKQGKWRFIVLDEAHTYSGAQGIEVGLLVRRLKHRLGHKLGQMRCIATSATLTDDDSEPARQFAKALFGEEFHTEDIIFGEPNCDYIPPSTPRQPPVTAYIHEHFDDLLNDIRQERWESTDAMALLMQEMDLISESELSLADLYTPPRFLWEVLRGNEDLAQLRKYMMEKGQPMDVTTIGEALFRDRLPPNQQEDALYHLIELAAMARPALDEPSLLPARYHLFVRPPQGVWACLNPVCPDKKEGEKWSKLFAIPKETCDACQASVYPLVICRTCGQVYVRLQKVLNRYLPEAALQDEPQQHYMTRRPIYENRALADADYEEDDEDDEDALIELVGESVLKQTEITLCMICQQKVQANGKCGCAGKSDSAIPLFLLQNERPVKKGKSKGTKNEVVEHMNECGRCHSSALKGTEIATEITLNALTPLAILTEDLYRSLPGSSQPSIQTKAGSGRKLLSFYDSRQGAARFAAFVQSIVNQQAYRRIIRESVRNTSTKTFWPDLEQISENSLELTLSYRVAHNDSEIDKNDLPRSSQYLNQSQRKRMVRYMRKQVFAEITTRLRSRQSLETLGLMSVHYFEPGKLPDFTQLARKIGLSRLETHTLIEYLLDGLRQGKVVTLPEGVQRDDPIFGRNKFSPRLMRGDAKQYEIAWIGKTSRHRRRKLVRKVLRYKGLEHDDKAIIQALTDILDWLIYESDLFDTSRPEDGYQLRHDRLFFQAHAQWYRCDQCQRLSSRGNALPCQHAYCQGTPQPLEIADLGKKNFYYDTLRKTIIPMRIEEHTAQLSPKKGRKYQNKFKSGEINMLSCSTTFELGIDLGDLQAVVMSNIPPTVANYKQRAGRAGRRTSGTAFILAWASNRPHDQTYFKNPAEIISGRVNVPYINVQNPIIIRRHVNAILLSEYSRFCEAQREYNKSVGAFFDEQTVGGCYYSWLHTWLDKRKNYLLGLLDKYAQALQEGFDSSRALQEFESDLRNKGFDYYQQVAEFYKKAQQELAQKQLSLVMDGRPQKDFGHIAEEIRHYGKLLERLQDRDIINYLSDRGVLPSYSFPLHTVELRIPPNLHSAKELRLQRNLQQGIREYAPGQEIVADKRIWKSGALDFFGKEPLIYSYHICPVCNHLLLENTAGKNLEGLDQPCPICHTMPKRGKWKQQAYIQPDGFRVLANESGQSAGQYVDRPFNLMQSALAPGSVKTNPVGQILSMGYDREGVLLYVNEGFKGSGFRICLVCGKHIDKRTNKCNGQFNGQPCPGVLERNNAFALGFKRDTDTLHLKFSNALYALLPNPEDMSFWLSLKYALLQGASRALQIERRDIDGVLFPEELRQQWQQTIVLYDNVPGGAGHVKRVEDEIGQVVASALEIVDCDCEKSCYRCLREYGNQWEHHLLDRNRVVDFLRVLDADLQKYKQGDIADLHPVVAVDHSAWLWEQVKNAKQQVVLYADRINLGSPTTEDRNWLDLIQELLLHKVDVSLYLRQLPDQIKGKSEATATAAHLRLLQRNKLELRLLNRKAPWVAIIDANTTAPCAIQAVDEEMVPLTNKFSAQLSVTHHHEVIREIQNQMAGYHARIVEHAELQESPNTIVRESNRNMHNEADYFSDFYAQPVHSMIVSDRYLDTTEKISNRLGAHITLAQQSGTLKRVSVHTRSGGDEQKRAISQLKSRFPEIDIKFRLDYHTAHDRYIEIKRENGSKARIIIGVGLDFIEPDGYVRQTFLVFQDPY